MSISFGVWLYVEEWSSKISDPLSTDSKLRLKNITKCDCHIVDQPLGKLIDFYPFRFIFLPNSFRGTKFSSSNGTHASEQTDYSLLALCHFLRIFFILIELVQS